MDRDAKRVHVFDFDHTVYPGDASRDFIIFCIKNDLRLLRYLPCIALALAKYIFLNAPRKSTKERVFSILGAICDVPGLVDHFWASNSTKIAKWYKEKHKPTDIFITASPEFLIKPIGTILGVEYVIGTRMDSRTGKISGNNCRGKEKVKRLKHEFPNTMIDEAYSDSLSDMPLFSISRKAIVVKKGRCIPLSSYRLSQFDRFNDLAFLRFLFVGGINAMLGTLFSYLYSRALYDPLVAFMAGFLTSLILSYFLNSKITFKANSRSLKRFFLFVFSYIPNFIILLISVYVLINIVGVSPLVAYIIVALLSAPITFLLLSTLPFSKERIK